MLSDTIKDIRRRNYLNQTAFAERIGVTQGAVSQWEHGLTKPNTDQLKTISMEFGISIDSLLADDQVESSSDAPKTEEAKLLVKGIDRLPKAEREKALNVVRAMFDQYADYFDEE